MTGASKDSEIRILSGDAAREVDPEGIPWPDGAFILFAFEGGKVVGRVGILPVWHIEGMWLAEHKRKGVLGYRLMTDIEDALRGIGNTHAMAFSHDTQPEIAGHLERLGYSRLPVTTFTKELTPCPSQQ